MRVALGRIGWDRADLRAGSEESFRRALAWRIGLEAGGLVLLIACVAAPLLIGLIPSGPALSGGTITAGGSFLLCLAGASVSLARGWSTTSAEVGRESFGDAFSWLNRASVLQVVAVVALVFALPSLRGEPARAILAFLGSGALKALAFVCCCSLLVRAWLEMRIPRVSELRSWWKQHLLPD